MIDVKYKLGELSTPRVQSDVTGREHFITWKKFITVKSVNRHTLPFPANKRRDIK